jgi:hypothetical protein
VRVIERKELQRAKAASTATTVRPKRHVQQVMTREEYAPRKRDPREEE